MEREKVKTLFHQVIPDRRILRIWQGKVAYWTTCFKCQTSFVPKEKVWFVTYLSGYQSPVTVALCPNCAKEV